VDEILVAVGRAPNVEGLGLEAAGVAFDRDGVKVDDRLRTANPRIFAAGDICSPYKFTHAADAMARVVLQNALFMGRKKASTLVIPWSTYTDPEIAHVGLYEQEARERGHSVKTFTVSLADIDRAVLDGETRGFARLHVDERRDDRRGDPRHDRGALGRLAIEDDPSLSHAGGGLETPRRCVRTNAAQTLDQASVRALLRLAKVGHEARDDRRA
jgi:hypothetical protein